MSWIFLKSEVQTLDKTGDNKLFRVDLMISILIVRFFMMSNCLNNWQLRRCKMFFKVCLVQTPNTRIQHTTCGVSGSKNINRYKHFYDKLPFPDQPCFFSIFYEQWCFMKIFCRFKNRTKVKKSKYVIQLYILSCMHNLNFFQENSTVLQFGK